MREQMLWYLYMKVMLKHAGPDWLKSGECSIVDAASMKTKREMENS